MPGPGVVTRFATRGGPSSGAGADTGRYFVAGLFERGRTDSAVLVRSFREFTDRFGQRAAYSAAWDSLATYFAEGGTSAYVARVVGAAATVGTLTLQDRDGTPVDTLKVDALGAGAWSAGVTVEVAAGTVAGTVKLIVRYGEDVEVFDNATTVADLANKLNASRYVRGTDLGSATAAPNNLPAVVAATALSAGADDRAAVTATDATDALDLFPVSLGTGAVALPGYSADLVGAALRAHAVATRRVAILAPGVGATASEVKAMATGLMSDSGGYTMLAYPWVRVGIAPGVTQLVSPEGYVAGARARAHTDSGPWAAAAGVRSAARYLVGIEREIGHSEGEELNEALVSCIRTIGGRIMLYGYRSLAIDQANYGLLTAQDTLNVLAQQCEDAMQPFVFAPIDGNGGLLGQVEGVLRGICESARLAGGLYAWWTDTAPRSMIDPGYSVDVGNSVNTPESLAQNILKAHVAVRLSPNAELVELTLTKVHLQAAL